MKKYEIRFKCTVTLEAKNEEEAIKKAWLRDSLDINGRYKYIGIKEIKRS